MHEARKAIRRARSLLALAEPELDVEAADAILRRTGDSLGALRDAHAVTLTALRLGKRLSDPRWRQAATVLALRADRLARRELAADPGFAKRRKAIGRAARRLDALPWQALKSAGIREGLLRQSRRVERAAQRANRDPTPDNLHAWRRRARRLRMQLDALDGLKIRIIGHDPTASKRLHRLSDRLGRQQDLVVLAGTLRRMRTLEHRRELLELLKAATPTR
ncbi:CHAD domain-containing protein [Pseudoxanthomonas koreensis]|uniref:CHAD domain-containing protein n=1 Tax=Pseudoxanthomonas koreensis TaxID=266061 RepID=UPI0013912ED9|nr:CHAD domain-containing protein [Pseudoxanthomonas koreensis]